MDVGPRARMLAASVVAAGATAVFLSMLRQREQREEKKERERRRSSLKHMSVGFADEDLEASLLAHGLERILGNLHGLGAHSVEDLQYLKQHDLACLGLSTVEMRRLNSLVDHRQGEDEDNCGEENNRRNSKPGARRARDRAMTFETSGSYWRIKGRGRPRRLIFVRHGESEANRNRDITRSVPDHLIHLTPQGRLQALEAGVRLKEIIGEDSVKFIVSPYVRTRETYNGISQAWEGEELEVRQDVRIREQEYGNFDSPDIAELHKEKRVFGAFYYRYPGGESPADCFDRASSFLESLYRNWEHNVFENHVVVGHGMMIIVMLMRFCQIPIEDFEMLDSLKNCEIIVLERQENQAMLKIQYTWVPGEEKRFGGLRTRPRKSESVEVWSGDPNAPVIESTPMTT